MLKDFLIVGAGIMFQVVSVIFYFFTQLCCLHSLFQTVQIIFSKPDLLKKSIFYQDPQSQRKSI